MGRKSQNYSGLWAAIAEFVLLAILMVAVPVVVALDVIVLGHGVTEISATELTQEGLLFLSVALMALTAWKRPGERGFFALVAGFFCVMLIREADNETLLLCQAAPRKWFEDGSRICVQHAPTYFGPVSFTVECRTGQGEIAVTVNPPSRQIPKSLLVRLRHPAERAIQSVQINGLDWEEFDRQQEWMCIPAPVAEGYRIEVRY